jgi:alpha-L-fucosidase 2
VLELLPALPKAWHTGQVRGLCARGGFTVDIQWKDGVVTKYRIASTEPRPVTIRVNGQDEAIQSDQL